MMRPVLRHSSLPMRHLSRCGAVALLAAFLASVLTACVSAEPRRELPRQPSGLQPAALFLSAKLPDDADGNGFLDTMDATVYVFADRYKASIFVPGTFEFRLVAKDGKNLGTWKFDEKQTAAAAAAFPPGPGYLFRLSLLNGFTDRLDSQPAELLCTFTSREGLAVSARPTVLRMGRIR